MKKGFKEEARGGFFEGFDFDLIWGFKGLQISLISLLSIVVILFIIFLIVNGGTELNRIAFKTPTGSDYLGIFAGIILFIAVPFLIGIKFGIFKKNRF